MRGFGGVYANQPVLVTGETGFKGTWLACWLHELGARVTGIALPPPTDPSLHAQADLGSIVPHRHGDIRDPSVLSDAIDELRPRMIFHLAAQAVVRDSYSDPMGTIATNVMGTAHLLDAVRRSNRPCAVVVITSDKCYQEREQPQGYREGDPLGGGDPYSASKACAEIVTAAFRQSFFSPARLRDHGFAVASVRGGNVLGPGDWARDRIVPDCVRFLSRDRPIQVRNPEALRPWQHVLEPLSGYLWLGALLLSPDAAQHCDAWNFGPRPDSCRPVREVVEEFIRSWGKGTWECRAEQAPPPEAHVLRLNIDKTIAELDWRPVWEFGQMIERTAHGYRRLGMASIDPEAVRELLSQEIAAYTMAAAAAGVAWAKDA